MGEKTKWEQLLKWITSNKALITAFVLALLAFAKEWAPVIKGLVESLLAVLS